MAETPDKAGPVVRVGTVSVAARGPQARHGPSVRGVQDIRIDLNERCFLFPAGKALTHLVLAGQAGGAVEMRAVFAYNQSRADSTVDRFDAADARILARAMVEAIYQARTQTVFLEGRRLALVCHPNGFVVVGHDESYELFLSGQLMIGVAHALLRAVDRTAPVESH